MACKVVNWAECLTRLALKNNVRGVQRYVNNMDRRVPMELVITIPFSVFPRFNVKGHNMHQEITQVVDYIMSKSAHNEQLSFVITAAARKDASTTWAYEVHPFYWPIFLCDWIDVEIVTMVLMAGLVDPTKNQFEIIRRYPEQWKHEEIYQRRPTPYTNPLNLIIVLLRTRVQTGVLDLINETNFKDSFPTTTGLNINIGELRFVGKRQLYWQPDSHITVWVAGEGFIITTWCWLGRSIFTVLFQSYWATYAHGETNTMTELRYKLLHPMITLGLEFTIHAGDFYIWYPPTSSIITNCLGEFIGHGLMNFLTICHASLPLILIWHGMPRNRMRFSRRLEPSTVDSPSAHARGVVAAL